MGHKQTYENTRDQFAAVHAHSSYFLMILLAASIFHFVIHFPGGNFRPCRPVCNSYQSRGKKEDNGNFTGYSVVAGVVVKVNSVICPDNSLKFC